VGLLLGGPKDGGVSSPENPVRSAKVRKRKREGTAGPFDSSGLPQKISLNNKREKRARGEASGKGRKIRDLFMARARYRGKVSEDRHPEGVGDREKSKRTIKGRRETLSNMRATIGERLAAYKIETRGGRRPTEVMELLEKRPSQGAHISSF